MRRRYLSMDYAFLGFFLGVLLPVFIPILRSPFWIFGLILLGLMVGFFLFVTLLDSIELSFLDWIVRTRRPELQRERTTSSTKLHLYSFGGAFVIGLSAALIFSPSGVTNFLSKILDNQWV